MGVTFFLNSLYCIEYIRLIHTYVYMNCWFKAFNARAYTVMFKQGWMYFSVALVFLCGNAQNHYSTDGTILINDRRWKIVLLDDGYPLCCYYSLLPPAVVLCLGIAAKAVHVRRTIRFVLTNKLIASITACFGIALICLHGLITSISNLFSSFLSDHSCYHGNQWEWKVCIYGCFCSCSGGYHKVFKQRCKI